MSFRTIPILKWTVQLYYFIKNVFEHFYTRPEDMPFVLRIENNIIQNMILSSCLMQF